MDEPLKSQEPDNKFHKLKYNINSTLKKAYITFGRTNIKEKIIAVIILFLLFSEIADIIGISKKTINNLITYSIATPNHIGRLPRFDNSDMHKSCPVKFGKP